MKAPRSMSIRKPNLKAFTLIEVLVVVAIIALLISILLPSLSAARAAGRNAACLANTKQFTTAITAYSVQYNNYIPRGGDPIGQHWTILVAQLLGDKRAYRFNNMYEPNMLPVHQRPVYWCPERSTTEPKPFVDYVCNDLDPNGPVDAAGWRSTKDNFIKLTTYKRLSEVIFVADAEKLAKNTKANYCTWLTDTQPNWEKLYADPSLVTTGISGVDAMDVWVGEHLPEGRTNKTDAPGPRRVARKMHQGLLTNSGYFDGHSESVRLCPSNMTDNQKYKIWLRRFGISETKLTLPNGADGIAVTANPIAKP
jgi:prepilin-type N-terminal cleavage/methylation domain-containing protein